MQKLTDIVNEIFEESVKTYLISYSFNLEGIERNKFTKLKCYNGSYENWNAKIY